MATTDKNDISAEVAASIRDFPGLGRSAPARLDNLPEFIHNKAAVISAHFLLPAGSRVVDMGCGTGEVTYALALLNPRWEVIGVDHDAEAVALAGKKYSLPNLSFQVADVSVPDVADESIDGIINSSVLHRVYSAGGYNTQNVFALIEKQLKKLKTGGTMLVRDYVLPPEGELVLLELPDMPSRGSDPMTLSDADLLVRFSQTARPMDGGYEGFFIEELPARRAETRLFRLPHKWALEFIHRKDKRAVWEKELRVEYTFSTWQDYRREFAQLGLRMVFSAPHWNSWVVKNCFKGRFQLYTEEYAPLSYPATHHFIVAQKVADKQSLALEERRPSQKPVGDLQIMIVRDKKSGAVHELVKRPGEYCDIVPYRITPDGRLVIYVRSGYPRPIVNAVLRGSHNLDGKKWSGHLVEPVTMDTVAMTDNVEENRKSIFDYVRSYAGLRPKTEESWYVGETYFPSPDRIDEAIEPVFIEVENPQKTSWPIAGDKDVNFTEIGSITELDGGDIVLASQVGLLPEPRLELHVFDLMARHGIQPPRWIGEVMPKLPGQPVKAKDPEDMLDGVPPAEFEEPKKGAIRLKAVKSVFVEEGKVGKGTRGLSAQDVEFIVSEDGVENIAIVLPVSRDWDNNLLVALDPKIMPVPNRLGGDGAMLNAPSFVLPKDVKTIEDAKAYVAVKFKVPVEQVGQLGESYFTHSGVMPQRVYPFTVSSPPKAGMGPYTEFAMVKHLWRLRLRGFRRFSSDFMYMLSRLQMSVERSENMTPERDMSAAKYQGFSLSTEKVAVEKKHAGYTAPPSRILGQRGPLPGPKEDKPEPPKIKHRLVDVYARLKGDMPPKEVKDQKEAAQSGAPAVPPAVKAPPKLPKPATLDLTPPDPKKPR